MKSSFIQRYVWPKIKKIPGLRLLALRANSAVNMIQGRKIIEYEGFLIQVPSRHPILGLQKEGPRESLLRAVSRHCFSASRDHYVDVGAHIGDTALVIEKSSEQKNLKSDLIDPSLFFTEFLIKNSKFLHAPTIHSKFAATDFPSKNIFGVLHHWSGNAELVDEGSKLLALASQQLQVGSVITSKTALVKIDCEGLDLRILHSIIMYGSLDSCKPSFVFECTLRSLQDIKLLEQTLQGMSDWNQVLLTDPSGLVIYAGLVGQDFYRLCRYQVNLGFWGRQSNMYYYDVALIHVDNPNLYDSVVDSLETMQFPIS